MKKYLKIIAYIIFIILLGVILHYYFILKPSDSPTSSKTMAKNKQTDPLYWVAPMDPSYRSDKPGKSPMGMDLIPVYSEDNATDRVIISPSVEQNLGVRTAPVLRTTLSREIDTVGYVMVDENNIEHVHTYTDGWVKKLFVKTVGEHVNKGQLLFELYSPTIINAQEEYILALKSGNTSLIEASNNKLLTLGVTNDQIEELKKTQKAKQLIPVYAEKPGIVSSLNVREGIYVKPEKDLITLEDLSRIWVLGEVFERQSQWVKKGQKAIATLSYLPGKEWAGEVDYVYPRLDPITHTLKVRLVFDNPEEILKPNMYADIIIFAEPSDNVLVIPREAVIYTGEGARVIVKEKDGEYIAKSIKIGIESDDVVEVLYGLEEGEIIVTSAQFLIDSESSLKASINRIVDEQEDSASPHMHN